MHHVQRVVQVRERIAQLTQNVLCPVRAELLAAQEQEVEHVSVRSELRDPASAPLMSARMLKLSGPALHEKHVRGLLANVDDAEDVRVRDAPDMLHRRERVAATHGALEEDFRCESASA